MALSLLVSLDKFKSDILKSFSFFQIETEFYLKSNQSFKFFHINNIIFQTYIMTHFEKYILT